MENLLPPLIILFCVVGIVVLLLRRGAQRASTSAEVTLASGPEAAAAASARLSEDQHQTIYSLIGRGLMVQAIAAYRDATGAKLIEARNAVLLMERYPQPFGGRQAEAKTTEPAPEETPEQRTAKGVGDEAPGAPAAPPSASPSPSSPSSASPSPTSPSSASPSPTSPSSASPPASDDDSAMVPAGTPEGRSTTRFPYRYRAIVSNGRQTLEVASNLLNDEIYEEIKALAQIGDAEDAARLLWKHSEISLEEARAFVELL